MEFNTKKIILRTQPKYLEELGKAVNIFGEDLTVVEFEVFLIEGKDVNGKKFTTLLTPMQQIVKNCENNDTGLPNPQHWILTAAVKLKENEK